MADHDRAAGEALERVLERRAACPRPGRSSARRAAAGSRPCAAAWRGAGGCARRPRGPHLLLLVAAAEVEAGHVRARRHLARADPHAVDAARDLLPDRCSTVQGGSRLVDVGELHRRRARRLAAVGRLLAGDHAEERRLAGAVRARPPRRSRPAGARTRDPRRGAGRRSPCSGRRPRPQRRPGGCPRGCGSRGGRSGRSPPRRAANAALQARLALGLAHFSATCPPTPSRARVRVVAPTRPSPRVRAGPASCSSQPE